MGREFGQLTRMRHVITYSLSPFEQRAFPHYFSKGIPNMLRRTRACILRVAPRPNIPRQDVAPQTLCSAHDLLAVVGPGRWFPNTGTEFGTEKAAENDPVLERGFPQAHWSLLLGRF
ncbi:hypothetical protein MC885_009056 [Smutsia gigantea]|nr:hypothetical protein MC885_009056 [Smutsia gigantea]